MLNLASFLQKSTQIIFQQTTISIQNLINNIQTFDQPQQNNQSTKTRVQTNYNTINDETDIIPLTVQNISITQRPLQQLQLEQSKIIQFQSKVSQIKKSRSTKVSLKPMVNESRIKQIEEEKKRIMEQLKKLDNEIVQIKKQKQGESPLQKSQYHKKMQISDDVQAKKNAQSLIKQLHLQKKKIEEKRKKMQQQQLDKRRRQDEQIKKQREEMQRKMKEQKRLLIQKRLEYQRTKRQERKKVDKQANQLIVELKKEEEIIKQRELIPGQLLEYQHKKKLLEKKSAFNMGDIQQHQQKYREMKSRDKELRREKSESTKLSKPIVPKYGKNVWVQRLQEQDVRRKQQDKMKELAKKLQLQKRMQYGNVVKTIFMSKHQNQKKREQSVQPIASNEQSVLGSVQQNVKSEYKKPQTPNVRSQLPVIPGGQKRQNQTDKKFKQRQVASSILETYKKSRVGSKSREKVIQKERQKERQRDPEQLEKIQKQKQREFQLRKQTKQRLKKLQNHSIELPKPEKVKYENYISKVKVKRQSPNEEWRKIMSNEKLSKEQKYKEMLNKAAHMQNQAKIKQDLRKNGDDDAVNLYIGSIQAKLALLQRF